MRVGKVLGTLLLIGIVTSAFMACYAAVYITNVIIPEATLDLSAYTINENSVIKYEDDNGQLVDLQTLVGAENRQWVDYDEIPQDLVNAVVAVEDKRFWEHNGVDWYRTAGAFVNMFIGMRNTFGGSTLTQQLVKNITDYDDVTVKRKILEIFTALELEKNYSKEDIITYYLNEIFLGQGCYGVQSASQMYFGKDVSELSLAECASLAGITNNPSLYSPYSTLEVTRYQCTNCKKNYSLTKDDVCSECGAKNSFDDGKVWTARDYNKARQELILDQMTKKDVLGDKAISKEEAEQAKAEKLVFRTDWDEEKQEEYNNANTSTKTIYSWYVEAVIDEVTEDLMEQTGLSYEVVTKMVYSGGLEIIVPYDPDVQAAVDEVYNDKSNLNYVSKTGQEMKSGITVVDNDTGYVVAIGGDVGEKTINRGWSYATDTVRQPGSSIKPLSVYAPAIEENLITPNTVTDDVPRWMGSYWLQNYPVKYRGLTTVLEGVTESINTVSANVLEKLGFQTSYEYMTEKFKISTMVDRMVLENGEVKSDIDMSPLAIGGLTKGISTFEMAAAYATFPRDGAFTEATTYLTVKDHDGNVVLDNKPSTEHILEPRTTYYINQLLTNVVSSGTGTAARISGQLVAGKTGTTDSSRDQWFVGYTKHYTAAVWIGYPNNDVMKSMWPSPSTLLWQKVMSRVHENLPREDFTKPSGLVTVSICKDCGNLATDSCSMDVRGSRVQNMTLLNSDVPSQYCSCHVAVDICTEGSSSGAYHLAGPYCPASSVKTVTLVDYTRHNESGSYILDTGALLSTVQGNGQCTVHNSSTPSDPEPSTSDEPTDPSATPKPGEDGNEDKPSAS